MLDYGLGAISQADADQSLSVSLLEAQPSAKETGPDPESWTVLGTPTYMAPEQ